MPRQTMMHGHRLEMRMTKNKQVSTHHPIYRSAQSVQMCNPELPIYKLMVEESEHDDNLQPWGWWNYREKRFQFVYCNGDLLEMCFPYGTTREETKGNGIKLPVTITELEVIDLTTT